MKITHDNNKIAFCGINCSACPAYVTARKEQVRAEAANLWPSRNYEYETGEITCKGCREPWGKKSRHCQECEIRNCARKKLYYTCAECADYPCANLQNLYKTLGENISRVNLDEFKKCTGQTHE